MQDYSHSSSFYLPVMTWKARRLALNVWNPTSIVQLTIMSLWCGLSLFKDNLLFSGQPVERSGLVALLGTTPLWWQSHSIRHQVPKSPCTTPLRREVKRSVLLLALVSSYFSLTFLPVPLWGGFVKRERIISDNLAMHRFPIGLKQRTGVKSSVRSLALVSPYFSLTSLHACHSTAT